MTKPADDGAHRRLAAFFWKRQHQAAPAMKTQPQAKPKTAPRTVGVL